MCAFEEDYRRVVVDKNIREKVKSVPKIYLKISPPSRKQLDRAR